MRDHYEGFRAYQNCQRLKQVYPPFFSKLVRHYTLAELSEGVQRSRQVAEVLRTVEKISGEVSDLNMEVMREIVDAREERNQGILREAVLSQGEVLDFLKIATCN